MKFWDRDSVWAQCHMIKLPSVPGLLVTYTYMAEIGLCQRLGVGGFVHILG